MSWRDISTAPKDGKTIIAWSEYSFEPATVAWRGKEWAAVWEGNHVIRSQSDFGTDYETPGPLTHWQPLPEPPKLTPEIAAHLNRQPPEDAGLPSDTEASS